MIKKGKRQFLPQGGSLKLLAQGQLGGRGKDSKAILSELPLP
jgi:hypothetical protein